MGEKITIDQITNRKFTIEIKGYKVEEVNDFLDDIMSEFLVYEKNIRLLKWKINQLNLEVHKLNVVNQKSNEALEKVIQEKINVNIETFSNSNIVKRISTIEKSLAEISSELIFINQNLMKK